MSVHSACETAAASHVDWVLALLPKHSHALTRATPGCLLLRGRAVTWDMLHLLTCFRRLKAVQGLIAIMSPTWGLTAGCDSCQTGHQDNTTTALTLTSTFDWPSIALQVCPENTQWSDSGRKQPWKQPVATGSSFSSWAECLRAGSERTSSNKPGTWCFSLKSERWSRKEGTGQMLTSDEKERDFRQITNKMSSWHLKWRPYWKNWL